MNFDIVIKRYDPALNYERNKNAPEEYRFPAYSPSETISNARISVHTFAAIFLDGDDITLARFQGSDEMYVDSELSTNPVRYQVVLYVVCTLPQEVLEDLVIAITEKFGVLETADADAR